MSEDRKMLAIKILEMELAFTIMVDNLLKQKGMYSMTLDTSRMNLRTLIDRVRCGDAALINAAITKYV